MPTVDRTSPEWKQHNREYQKKWYLSNKNKQYTKTRNRLRVLSDKLTDYKKNIKCERCGENHPSCMDFHHKDPSKKEVIISKVISKGWGWDRIKKEIDKCAVLCSNCHRKEHWKNTD